MAEQQQAKAVVSSTAALTGMEKILNQPLDQINKAFCESLFAAYYDKATNKYMESPFNPQMRITLTPDKYKYVKEKTYTDLGRLLVNRYMLERTGFIEHIGYFNGALNDDGLADLNAKVNNCVLMDKMTTKDLGNYIDSRDRMGFWVASFLGPSITPALIRPMHDVNKRKAELFKQREAELKSDNAVTQVKAAGEIEKELIGMVKENLKQDETRKFIDNSFRDGELKTTGTAIDKILPPMPLFGATNNRQEKKETIVEKLSKFFEKYLGIV